MKLPKSTTKHTTNVVVVALIVAFCAFIIASYVHTKRIQAADAAQAHTQQAAATKSLKDEVTSLNGQNAALRAQKKAICDYVTALQFQKATKSLVTLPTAARCDQ